MAHIAFILLCHKDPAAILAQAERLTATGDFVAIHFDARAPAAMYGQIRDGLAGNPRAVVVERRVKCGWGEWSLVRATLNACDAALTAFPEATHFYMLSGDCMPIKSARYARAFLDQDDADFIESYDFFDSDWIKTGMRAERLVYRHLFNERQNKWLFYQSLNLQRRLGLTRSIPDGLRMMIGSQWWCLRRDTLHKIVDFSRARKDVTRFFATTWIPDETYFQTLVRHLVPRDQIRCKTLTFLMFTDYGMPATFYNDHHDLLLAQDALFARKISPEAKRLKSRLGDLWADEARDFQVSDEGRALHGFLTGLGRQGQRFAPRAWEDGARLAPRERLILLACKKWHVAQRLATRIQEQTDLPTHGYLFNVEDVDLPDLGGIENRLDKRTRHRRAMIRLLLDAHDGHELVICVDPSANDLIDDLARDKGEVHVLEIQCSMDTDWLKGHAHRVGLVGATTDPEAVDRILPALRRSLSKESEHLAEAMGPSLMRIAQTAPADQNALSLARVLNISQAQAEAILDDPALFDD